nr:hypothetical protein [Enterococcus sp. 665A]MBO1340302.1 hypothetical protein [Enterococcus sp. 665A]
MKRMPKTFENKLRKYNELMNQTSKIHNEISNELDKAGVPYENLTATAGIYPNDPVTESLAYINNGECKTEESLNVEIESIRKVYEYFVNK